MNKYIDLDNLLLFGKCKTEFNADKNEWNNVQFTVPMDKIKTLSVLNIIMCSECKYYNTENSICKRFVDYRPPDGFCNYAKQYNLED